MFANLTGREPPGQLNFGNTRMEPAVSVGGTAGEIPLYKQSNSWKSEFIAEAILAGGLPPTLIGQCFKTDYSDFRLFQGFCK